MAITYSDTANAWTDSAASVTASVTASTEWGNLITALVADDRGESIACTYGGDAMTRIIDRQDIGSGGGGDKMSGFYILTEKTGANDLVATRSSSSWSMMVLGTAYKYAGTYVNAAETNAHGGSGSTNVASIQSGDLVFGACISSENSCGGASPNPTTSGWTSRGSGEYRVGQSGHMGIWAGEVVTSGTDQTVSYNSINCWPHNISAMAFRDGTAPATGIKRGAMFFSLAGLTIPAATLAGLYKAGAVAL